MVVTFHWRGYPVIWLRRDGNIHKKYFVHRLVAIHFIPNTDDKPIVNHKDHNKANCHHSNLEWMTLSENTTYYYRMQKRTEAAIPAESEMPF